MLAKFDPKKNSNDHRILFEIISRKVDKKDEQFDSDDEPLTRRQATRMLTQVRLGTEAKLSKIFVDG